MRKGSKVLTLICCMFSLGIQAHIRAVDPLKVVNLRVEFLSHPVGIDRIHPRLSWELNCPGYGIVQTSYRILVSSSLALLDKNIGDVWDSHKVTSSASLNVPYEGKPLGSMQYCYWKVNVSTNKNPEGSWSKPSYWSMGLLHAKDWNGYWIGLDSSFAMDRPYASRTRLSARYFRHTFFIKEVPQKAMLYISGLGIGVAYINGQRIGHDVLSPDPTQYTKRAFYLTYDVTHVLKAGANAMGVILGNGRFFAMRHSPSGMPSMTSFGYPKMILQLVVTNKDGSKTILKSDTTWKVSPFGPIVSNNEYDGEDYDARKAFKDWTQSTFNDASWMQAQKTMAPCQQLEAQMDPPVRIMDSLAPRNIRFLGHQTWMVDMGQNMVGWARLRLDHGKPGDTITLRYAERLASPDTLYVANLRSAEATDHYIMKSGSQTFQPEFTYHGFRYIEVHGYPGILRPQDIQGEVVYDDVPTIGQFSCSNPIINAVYKNAYWGIRGNYRGMPTDCPQRDERMGWLGDRAVGSLGESFIFNNNTLYAKWMQDIQDAQKSNGSLPDVAPSYWTIYSDNMTWPGAYPQIVSMLYQQFGNLDPMRKHYSSIKLWMDYMQSKYLHNGILGKDTYGDWCMPPESPTLIHSKDPSRITSGILLGTAYFYHISQLMYQFAKLTQHDEDTAHWMHVSREVRAAFNRTFLHADSDYYANNTATSNLFALAFQLAPDSIRNSVFQHIVYKTMHDFSGHISTGLVGAQVLMRTLTHYGRPDIAFKLASNTSYPSWGYMVRHGATTIWELWNGNTANPAMNSGNHVMLLGDLVTWLYEDVAGIRSDPNSPGFKQLILEPVLISGLHAAHASYHSGYGLISSSWQWSHAQFYWAIKIPPNTHATIYIPAQAHSSIVVNGKPSSMCTELKLVGRQGNYTVFSAGSGTYEFTSQLNHFKSQL